jgi:molybdate transport system permease protein
MKPGTAKHAPPRSFLTLGFGVILGLYIFFILGVILADLLLVSGTELGRLQFIESIRDPHVLHAMWLSVWTSSLASIIALVIAVPAAHWLSRSRGRLAGILDALIDIPIILPPLLFGISLLVLFQRSFVGPALRSLGLKFVHEPAGIVLVQVLIATAYGARMLRGAFDALDPRLAAVARTLGCTPGKAFWHVTLPTVRRQVVSAAVIIWARALALYGPIIAFVGATAGYTEVLPVRMYLEMSIGRLEAALAIALLMIGLAGVVLVVMKWAGGRHPGDLNRLRSF